MLSQTQKLSIFIGVLVLAMTVSAPRVFAFVLPYSLPLTNGSDTYEHVISSVNSGSDYQQTVYFTDNAFVTLPVFWDNGVTDAVSPAYSAATNGRDYCMVESLKNAPYTVISTCSMAQGVVYNAGVYSLVFSDTDILKQTDSTVAFAANVTAGYGETLSRFINITPRVGTTTATTTTIGATIYINPADYISGMYLSMSFTNQTLSLTGGSALDAFNAASGQGIEIHLPLSSGMNVVSTTTTFLYAGRTDGKYSVESDGFLNSLPLLGDLFSPNTLLASTTYFYVGFKSGLDNAVDLGGASVGQYILTGTTTGANTIINCGQILNGGITPCLVSLLVPSATVLGDDMLRLRNGFLSVYPLGYVTRFIEIIVTTATSTMPSISYTTASTSMFGTATFAFDPFGAITASTSPLLYTSDQSTPKTIWQIMQYPTYVIVYLMLLFMIIHDLTGVSKHAVHHKKQ